MGFILPPFVESHGNLSVFSFREEYILEAECSNCNSGTGRGIW